MKNYRSVLLSHLADYARTRLGIFEQGVFKGKPYNYILPSRLRFLNFLEAVRSELQAHLSANQSIQLHKYFHHLNSSQAFAFNLFFAYLKRGGLTARTLSATLGCDEDVEDWSFEHVEDRYEGTNVDVMWRIPGNGCVFCEVKLSENEFGGTKNDERHRAKLEKVYFPRLQSIVPQHFLEPKIFFANYQLLRNISLLAENDRYFLIFLLPRENEALNSELNNVIPAVVPNVRQRIKIAYIESCIEILQNSSLLQPELKIYAASLAEKYVPHKGKKIRS